MSNLAHQPAAAPFRPMLAIDADETAIRYPVIVQPKIDGFRALNVDGNLTGRSMKAFANKATTDQFSRPEFAGLDGELFIGNSNDSDLCRNTTSAVTRIQGEPDIHWMIFDCIGKGTYSQRYEHAKDRVAKLNLPNVHIIPSVFVANHEELLEVERDYLAQGYEGIILRIPNGAYKNGRVSASAPHLTRIKRFIEEEARVLSFECAKENTNAAQINALGETYRNSHKAGLIEKAEIGALICQDLKTGQRIKVGAGSMTKAEREHYAKNPQDLIGKIVKYSHFEHGRKDKPRFPTFVCIRPDVDRDAPVVSDTEIKAPPTPCRDVALQRLYTDCSAALKATLKTDCRWNGLKQLDSGARVTSHRLVL